MSKPFDDWSKLKKLLDARETAPFFKEREVWFAAVGVNIGHEEDGKNTKYERPVLVLKRFNKNLFFGVAFSSIFKPENDFYHTVLLNGKASSVILSQARAYSAKRLLRRMATLDRAEFEIVKLLSARTLFGSEIIKTDLGEPRSSGPEGIYNSSIAPDAPAVKHKKDQHRRSVETLGLSGHGNAKIVARRRQNVKHKGKP